VNGRITLSDAPKEYRDPAIDNLRILATVAIVWTHVSADVIARTPPASSTWLIGIAADSFSRWAVPTFIMISGALLISSDEKETISSFYKKRATRIIVPLLFWTIFYQLWVYINLGSLDLYASARGIITGQPYYHMWFLYMMMGLYLITPYLNTFVSNATSNHLLSLIVILLVVASIEQSITSIKGGVAQTFISMWPPYVGYYLLGYYLRANHLASKINNVRCLLLLYVLSASVIVILTVSLYPVLAERAYPLMFQCLNPLVMIMAVSVFMLINTLFHSKNCPLKETNGCITRISNLTLGVYVIHPFIIDSLRKYGLSALSGNPVIFIPVVSTLVLCLSLFLSFVLSRIPYIRRII